MGGSASVMAGKAVGPPYSWEQHGAQKDLLDTRRQELLAVQVMTPEQLLEWNQLNRTTSSTTAKKGLAAIVPSAGSRQELLEGPFGKPTITGADAAALVGYVSLRLCASTPPPPLLPQTPSSFINFINSSAVHFYTLCNVQTGIR